MMVFIEKTRDGVVSAVTDVEVRDVVCGQNHVVSSHSLIHAVHSLRSSGGTRVFAARGKRLCCHPPPSGVFRNLKRYISGVHFQKFSNFSIFFTVNISTIFFSHPKVPRCRGTPLDTPLVPPVRSAIDILMVTTRQWCGL